MLIDKLQIQIHERQAETLTAADTIIMHPDTFGEIFQSIKSSVGSGPSQVPVQGIHIRGCKVYRSEDVPVNEFVIR